MTVSQAVATRRTIRDFLDRPVDGDVVTDIVRRAARAPSGGNLQPWIVHTLEGERLKQLKAFMRRRCAEEPEGEPMTYAFYPADLTRTQRQRRDYNSQQLYDALGNEAQDSIARKAWIYGNFQFFGAPYGMFLLMDRRFGAPQWLDLGIYIQTVMLLLQEAGLDSCYQADWAMFEGSVSRFLGIPADLMLICGLAVGYRDPDAPINHVVSERDDPIMTFG